MEDKLMTHSRSGGSRKGGGYNCRLKSFIGEDKDLIETFW